MNRLQLIIKRPGRTVLAKLVNLTIDESTAQQILALVTQPDQYMVVRKPPMGFRPPEGGANARS